MWNFKEASELRSKYTHFRVLVIGRANAGKTTLLKRVCNTQDEPCIFDEENNNLLEPTSERGIHDIRRPFAFSSNPEFIFHDSPGFETGDERQLKDVQSFIEEQARSTDVKDQLHAIWFCFVTDNARPLLELETRFFNEKYAGSVPVIAIFTKFDDFITQIYDWDREEEENRKLAVKLLEKRFIEPLSKYKFPPQGNVCFEGINDNDGDHQEQVKELMTQTVDALDNLALKILLVSVQRNNLELCIKYAIEHSSLLFEENDGVTLERMFLESIIWFRHSYYMKCDYEKSEGLRDKKEWDDQLEDLERLRDDWDDQLEDLELLEEELKEWDDQLEDLERLRDLLEELEEELELLELLERDVLLELLERDVDEILQFIASFIHEQHKVSLAVLSGILICLSNSFWQMSKPKPLVSTIGYKSVSKLLAIFTSKPKSTPFKDAFCKVFKSYIKSSNQQKVEREVQMLGDYPSGHLEQKEFKSTLLTIILKQCLSYQEVKN